MSRKSMIYGLNTKDAETILKFILNFCIHLNFPNKLIQDNGPEFKNSKLNEFCDKNDVYFIHGVPYNPHIQGNIERFH